MTDARRSSDFWSRWQEHLSTGSDATALIARASEANLVAILSTRTPTERQEDIDAVAAEVLTRLLKRQTELPSGALDVLRTARAAYATALRGERPLLAAQEILQGRGQALLGSTVEAASASSVASTRRTLDSAEDHAATVRASIAESRLSEELAADASLTAAVGTLLTDGLAEHMSDPGERAVGRAAEAAAKATKDATDRATTAARQNRHLEEGRPVPIEADQGRN